MTTYGVKGATGADRTGNSDGTEGRRAGELASIEEIAGVIGGYHSFLLICHVAPDGDTLGSALALCRALRARGKTARVVCADAVPPLYAYLPGADDVLTVGMLDDDDAVEVAVAIDVSDRGRLGAACGCFDGAARTVCIDHHGTNSAFAQVNCIDAGAAATGELMLALIRHLRVPLNREIALCLYTAISTDTGNFSFDCTRPQTLVCAAELLSCGIDVQGLTRRLFREMTPVQARLLGRALCSLELYGGGKIGMLRVSRAEMEEIGATDPDCEGIVNYAVDLTGVVMAVFLKESADGKTKVSLRSQPPFDVSKIASKLGGGGHARASGITMSMGIVQAQDVLREALEGEL